MLLFYEYYYTQRVRCDINIETRRSIDDTSSCVGQYNISFGLLYPFFIISVVIEFFLNSEFFFSNSFNSIRKKTNKLIKSADDDDDG